jgi:hypothetical protein
MAEKCKITIAVIDIDIGQNSSHVVGLDPRGSHRSSAWRRALVRII